MLTLPIALPHIKSTSRPFALLRRLSIDPWFLATILVACTASIISLWYYFKNNEILLYSDSYSHMLIARRIFDNTSPGLAQFGGVWLPLPHIIMLPFIYSDYLWKTGLAGSLSSMPAFIVAAIYLFLTARKITHDSRASFLGTLIFIMNPNMLYLQTTPMSEAILVATMTATCYYFVLWALDGEFANLIFAAIWAFFATLARYDGWPLFLVLVVCVGVVSIIKRNSHQQTESNIIIFSLLGGFGIALWILWNAMIFGDPLYFEHGPFSSQAQQVSVITAGLAPTYHNLYESIRYFLYVTTESMGPLIFAVGIAAFVLFVVQRKLSLQFWAIVPFFVAFPFYMYAMYSGQDIIYVPGAVPSDFIHQLYNVRFGIETLTPIAIVVAHAIRRWPLGQVVFTGILIVQTIITTRGGIVSVQDGQYGLSCSPSHSITNYLAQHYDSGLVMNDTYNTMIDFANANIQLKSLVYEGSGALWDRALNDPAQVVTWIIVRPDDLIAQQIDLNSPVFLSQFALVDKEPSGFMLFHHRDLAPLPNRPLPNYLLHNQRVCNSPK